MRTSAADGTAGEAGSKTAPGTVLEQIAADAAQAAGRVLRDRWQDSRLVETKSSPTDPVSDADRAAEQAVLEVLARARPADALLAEESGERSGTTGLRWIIDPLDGTVNYLYGRADWAVSVAVEDRDGPLAGAVHIPVRDETFTASRGAGARLGGHRLCLGTSPPAGLALVGTGFSYDAGRRREQAHRLVDLLPRVRDVRRGGACAVDLSDVAAGRLDAYFEDDLRYWDLAAGVLIAAEAGATVTYTRQDDAGAVLAAAPTLHREMATMLDAGLGSLGADGVFLLQSTLTRSDVT